MNELCQDIKQIYNCLSDDLSKEIFSYRLLYCFFEDDNLLNKLVLTTNEGKEFSDILHFSDKKKVMFGAGSWGKAIVKSFPNVKFECFVDNYVINMSEDGIPVISFQEYIKKYYDSMIIISSRVHHEEMHKQLLEAGILEENIINAGRINDEFGIKQYFDLPQLKQKPYADEENFVDAGCLDGNSSIFFAKWCRGNYKKIWGFEPDEENAQKCERTFELNGVKNFEIIRKGLWNENTKVRFCASSDGLSRISENGSHMVEVVRLDDIIPCGEKVTFIKMDIEGAEYDALIGAKRIIKEQRPKLAISVYHKPKDIVEISRLILSYNKNYKLYLRHYSLSSFETVLYAI